MTDDHDQGVDERQDQGLRDRIARSGEDALGKLASELLESQLVTTAIGRVFEAREKATQAQAVAFGALNLPSAADLERLTRRIRSVSQRLDAIEDGVDKLDRRLGSSRRPRATRPSATSSPARQAHRLDRGGAGRALTREIAALRAGPPRRSARRAGQPGAPRGRRATPAARPDGASRADPSRGPSPSRGGRFTDPSALDTVARIEVLLVVPDHGGRRPEDGTALAACQAPSPALVGDSAHGRGGKAAFPARAAGPSGPAVVVLGIDSLSEDEVARRAGVTRHARGRRSATVCCPRFDGDVDAGGRRAGPAWSGGLQSRGHQPAGGSARPRTRARSPSAGSAPARRPGPQDLRRRTRRGGRPRPGSAADAPRRGFRVGASRATAARAR